MNKAVRQLFVVCLFFRLYGLLLFFLSLSLFFLCVVHGLFSPWRCLVVCSMMNTIIFYLKVEFSVVTVIPVIYGAFFSFSSFFFYKLNTPDFTFIGRRRGRSTRGILGQSLCCAWCESCWVCLGFLCMICTYTFMQTIVTVSPQGSCMSYSPVHNVGMWHSSDVYS